MKQIIFEMQENGLLNKLRKKWTMLKPDCRPIHNEGTPISLEKFISLPIILMIGIFIAFIIIIIENIFHTHQPKKHVSIHVANNIRLQKLFMKLQDNLNDNDIFHDSPITMRTLLKEIQNHNDILLDADG